MSVRLQLWEAEQQHVGLKHGSLELACPIPELPFSRIFSGYLLQNSSNARLPGNVVGSARVGAVKLVDVTPCRCPNNCTLPSLYPQSAVCA